MATVIRDDPETLEISGKKKEEIINLTSSVGLESKEYRKILCYPRFEAEEFKRRIEEIKYLGVKSIEFKGTKKIDGKHILGKGSVGIVVLAHLKNGLGALKIRRVDANRPDMRWETVMLEKANKLKIGPRLLGSTKNTILLEFIDGQNFPLWLKTKESKIEKSIMKNVLRNLLLQARKLDAAGLDHGELRFAAEHVLVTATNKPYIIDYESASIRRRASNVTSLYNYLFLGSDVSKRLCRRINITSTAEIIDSLRTYKKNATDKTFNDLLEECGI